MNGVSALAAGTIGSLVADVICFYLGRHYGNRVLRLICRNITSDDDC